MADRPADPIGAAPSGAGGPSAPTLIGHAGRFAGVIGGSVGIAAGIDVGIGAGAGIVWPAVLVLSGFGGGVGALRSWRRAILAAGAVLSGALLLGPRAVAPAAPAAAAFLLGWVLIVADQLLRRRRST